MNLKISDGIELYYERKWRRYAMFALHEQDFMIKSRMRK